MFYRNLRKFSKRFVEDSQKITDQRILAKIRQTLVEAGAANSLKELSNLTELSGYLIANLTAGNKNVYHEIGLLMGLNQARSYLMKISC